MEHRNIILVFVLGIFVLLVSTVGVAAGISAPYWNGYPLELAPGESKDISFALKDDKDERETVEISLEEGSEIAEITSGTSYIVDPGTDARVMMRIIMPNDASVGDSYKVKFVLKSLSAGEGNGNVQLSVGYNVDFPVVVAESVQEIVSETTEPPTVERDERFGGRTNTSVTLIAAIIVVLIVIVILLLWALVRKRKKGSTSKKNSLKKLK